MLSNEASGFEELATLKGQLNSEVIKLKAEKAELDPYVLQLKKQKNTVEQDLKQAQKELTSSLEKRAKLWEDIANLGSQKSALDADIQSKEQKVSDFKEQESKRDSLLHEIDALKSKINRDKKRWEIFESFLGFVHPSSIQSLKDFAVDLPDLIKEAEEGKFSVVALQKQIMEELGVANLLILKCSSCQARFYVDKAAPDNKYLCPIGGYARSVEVDKNALAILKKALSEPIVKQEIQNNVGSLPAKTKPMPKDKGSLKVIHSVTVEKMTDHA